MVNLLPDTTKKKFIREYYLSLASAALFIVAAIMASGALLTVPSYLLARSEAESAGRYVSSLEETLNLQEKTGAAGLMATLAEQTDILVAYDRSKLTAELIQEIERSLSSGVRISHIEIRRVGTETGEIRVSGNARSRIDLLAFVDALKTISAFRGVSVPVSQLAKETNIDFSFSFEFDFSES